MLFLASNGHFPLVFEGLVLRVDSRKTRNTREKCDFCSFSICSRLIWLGMTPQLLGSQSKVFLRCCLQDVGICWLTTSIFELLAKKKKAGLCTWLFYNKTLSAILRFSNFVSFQYFDSVPTAKLLPCLRGIQRHHPGVKILRIRKVTSL